MGEVNGMKDEKKGAPLPTKNDAPTRSLYEEIVAHLKKRNEKVREYNSNKYGPSVETNCVFHDDGNPSMHVHELGWFKCFACGEKGSIFKLAEHLGINVKTNVKFGKLDDSQRSKALQYIKQRFRLENDEQARKVMSLFNMRIGFYKAQEPVLGIWIDLFNGSWTFRGIEEKYYRNESASGKIPAFGGLLDILHTQYVVITEGVFDALTINYLIKVYEQAFQATSPYVAICTQGGMFSSKQVLNYLAPYGISKIILAFDNDDKGKEYTEDFIKEGLSRGLLIEVVNIPDGYKDVNELYVKDPGLFERVFSERLTIFDWYVESHKELLTSDEGKKALCEKLQIFLRHCRGKEKDLIRKAFVQTVQKYGLERFAIGSIQVKPHLSFISGTDLLEKEYPPRDFIVENFLPTGLVLFAGKSKLGKSWFALYTAMHIATNEPLFGMFKVNRSGLVYYFALEDHERRLQSRMRMLIENVPEFQDKEFSNLFCFTPHIEQQFKLDESGFEFLEDIAVIGVSLIIIDTYGRAKVQKNYKNEYDYETSILSRLQRIALQHNTCIMLIHHTKKSYSEDTFDNILGSTALLGVADAAMVFERLRTQNLVKLHITGRDVEEQSIALEFDIKEGKFFKFAGNAEEYELSELQREVLMILKEPFSVSEIVRELKDSGRRVSRQSVYYTVEKLLERGLIDEKYDPKRNVKRYLAKKSEEGYE